VFNNYNTNFQKSTDDSAEDLQKFFEIVRQRRRKFHIFSRTGMYEAKHHGMQHLSLQVRNRTFFWPVERVTQNRMSYAGEMYPDLMCPSCFQPAFKVRKSLEFL